MVVREACPTMSCTLQYPRQPNHPIPADSILHKFIAILLLSQIPPNWPFQQHCAGHPCWLAPFLPFPSDPPPSGHKSPSADLLPSHSLAILPLVGGPKQLIPIPFSLQTSGGLGQICIASRQQHSPSFHHWANKPVHKEPTRKWKITFFTPKICRNQSVK